MNHTKYLTLTHLKTGASLDFDLWEFVSYLAFLQANRLLKETSSYDQEMQRTTPSIDAALAELKLMRPYPQLRCRAVFNGDVLQEICIEQVPSITRSDRADTDGEKVTEAIAKLQIAVNDQIKKQGR